MALCLLIELGEARDKRGKRHGIANFDRIKQRRPSQQGRTSQQCRPSQPESVHRKNCSTSAVVCVCERSHSPIFVSGSFCVGLMPPDFNREEILAGRLRRSTRCRLLGGVIGAPFLMQILKGTKSRIRTVRKGWKSIKISDCLRPPISQ